MKRFKRMFGLAAALAGVCGILGCASTPPPRELVDARAGYQLAASNPGAIRAQADVAEAKESLQRAEAAFADDPSGDATREWSYIASRKAGSARAKANALSALEDKKAADLELRDLRAQQQSTQRAELAGTRGQVASEKQARAIAEQKTRDALATIAGSS